MGQGRKMVIWNIEESSLEFTVKKYVEGKAERHEKLILTRSLRVSYVAAMN